jgi:hypothetical protein
MHCRVLTVPYGGVPFFPSVDQIGEPFIGLPTIVERLPGEPDPPEPNIGRLGFLIRSNPSHPSRCSILMSMGVGIGASIEHSGSPSTTPGTLTASASLVVNCQCHTSGVFANAAARVWAKLYVEEFDPTGTFVRAIVGQPAFVAQQGAFYVFGPGDTRNYNGTSGNPSITVASKPGFTYLVWVDLEGFIESAGFGGLGGSQASANVVVSSINEIRVCFIH